MATSTTKTKIVQFSKQEYYDTLVSTGSVTVDGVTYEYSPDDTIYVTPSAIYFTNVEVASNDWEDNATTPDTGYEFYAYKAVLNTPGVTPTSVVQVIFADEQVRSGDYCNPVEPGEDTVTIYSNNNSAITIPLIISGEPAIVGISQTILAEYQLKPKKITIEDGTTTALADNTEYSGTNLSTVTFTYPSGNFECYMSLSFASSGTITVTFPTSQYIGQTPSFENGKTYEISIRNGVVIAGEVTSGA